MISHPFGIEFAATIQIAPNALIAQRINIILNFTQGTERIGRTAKTTDIFRPLLRPAKSIRQIGTDP